MEAHCFEIRRPRGEFRLARAVGFPCDIERPERAFRGSFDAQCCKGNPDQRRPAVALPEIRILPFSVPGGIFLPIPRMQHVGDESGRGIITGIRNRIEDEVQAKFGVKLEPEPVFL